jgi:recombination endonuclease VII
MSNNRKAVVCAPTNSPESIPAYEGYRKERYYMRKYGVSYYGEVEPKFGTPCPCCGKILTPNNYTVDHDKDSNITRSVICSTCNVSIGMANHSPETLENMAKYLRRYGK